MLERNRHEARGQQVEVGNDERNVLYKGKMIDTEEMERESKEGKDFSEDLEQAARAEQIQRQYERTVTGRYSQLY